MKIIRKTNCTLARLIASVAVGTQLVWCIKFTPASPVSGSFVYVILSGHHYAKSVEKSPSSPVTLTVPVAASRVYTDSRDLQLRINLSNRFAAGSGELDSSRNFHTKPPRPGLAVSKLGRPSFLTSQAEQSHPAASALVRFCGRRIRPGTCSGYVGNMSGKRICRSKKITGYNAGRYSRRNFKIYPPNQLHIILLQGYLLYRPEINDHTKQARHTLL